MAWRLPLCIFSARTIFDCILRCWTGINHWWFTHEWDFCLLWLGKRRHLIANDVIEYLLAIICSACQKHCLSVNDFRRIFTTPEIIFSFSPLFLSFFFYMLCLPFRQQTGQSLSKDNSESFMQPQSNEQSNNISSSSLYLCHRFFSVFSASFLLLFIFLLLPIFTRHFFQDIGNQSQPVGRIFI